MNDLDDRILAAEQRLIAREQVLGRHVAALGQRVHRALQPRHLIVPVLGAVLLLVATGWLIGRGGRRRAAGGRIEPAPAAGGASRWMDLLALAWPLLSQVWRQRAGPVAAAVSLGQRLSARHRRAPPPTAGPAQERPRGAHPDSRPGRF